MRTAAALLLSLLLCLPASGADAPAPTTQPQAVAPTTLEAFAGQKLYTTYFYTATEAIIHGFENDTLVRIISMERGGTVYSGKVDRRQTIHVPTGRGVFSFVANKKASILVGTPSACAVVGYWLRDQNGSFRSDTLFGQLPSSASHSPDCRVIAWAWEDCEVTITDLTADKLVHKGKLKAGAFHEIVGEALAPLRSHVLEFRADRPAISAQVYYDEGYFVPAAEGRGAGRLFRTYVGKITEGKNDLNLISYYTDAKATVTDIDSGKDLWSGVVPKGGVYTLTLAGNHVKVTSDVDISVLVAPYKHYGAGYAEHHFGVGGEGTGIETDFLLTTPGELWVFSYYAANRVTVTDATSGRELWSKVLGAGEVHNVNPGHGFFRVKSDMGISVMGGASACGAEFSPASTLFAVDEALFKVVQEIQAQRQAAAAQEGRTLTTEELNAPMSAPEAAAALDAMQKATGRKDMKMDEVNARMQQIKEQQQQQQTNAPATQPDGQ
ncbi:MAG: hypothetical protein BIFFINMI_02126 [Phycisphaerae bacterium]|nr:hypothetical protein [Phycisphaerae bacterium]